MRNKIFLGFLFLCLSITSNLFGQDLDEPIAFLQPVVDSWNKALNSADLLSLEKLYSKEVYSYGTLITKEKCLESKKQFYSKNPDFSQEIEPIDEVRMPYDGRYEVYFKKTSTTKGKAKEYPAFLLIDLLENGKLQVAGESDLISETNYAKRISGVGLEDGSYCFTDGGTLYNPIAVPAPYELGYNIEISNGQITGSGSYYMTSMRSYYDLSITGEQKENGILSLQIRAEGPNFGEDADPNDFMEWNQEWKFTGQILRWLTGDMPSSIQLSDQGCN